MKRLNLIACLLLVFSGFLLSINPYRAIAQTRIGDLVRVENADDIELIGYGLVTGLDRTGDRTVSRRGSAFTVQSIANMLTNFGIDVDPDHMRTRNVAAVMVTATLSPYNAPGSNVDVTVSSLGDASSLTGGVLLQTPLMDPDNQEVYVKAQGSLVTGGVTAEVPGARVGRGQSLAGTIPGGGNVIDNEIFEPDGNQPARLIMKKPNYQNSQRIANEINETFETDLARVINAGMVEVQWPDGFTDIGDLNFFISEILELEISVDTPARVVINERTGTVVAGGNTLINEVLVAHGAVQIQTQVTPFVAQPPPLTEGETIVGDIPEVALGEQRAQTMHLETETTVADLAATLNTLGFTSRDIISIFQAIDRAGALKGELIIM